MKSIAQSRRRRGLSSWRRIFLAALSCLGCLVAVGGAWTAYVLSTEDPARMRSLGRFLWVQQTLRPADIIYVLGGDYSLRIPHAVDIYRRGLAPKIVIPYEDLNMEGQSQEHFSEASQRLLQEMGVPADAVFLWKVGSGVSSTSDEMKALDLYLQTFSRVRRVIIVTSAIHTRRALYTAGRVLAGDPEIQVSGVESKDWSFDTWWLVEQGRNEVWTEWRKLLYYVPRYFLG
jgi:uncharacterized SAM-binding protein YcdF (DUF218 family)